MLAANHNSNLDPWPLGLPLFPRRLLRFMGKSELFIPLSAPIHRAGGAFPVRRGERRPGGDRDGGRARAGRRDRGHVPGGDAAREGAAKKYEARPHTGAARIALEAGVPLVPAAITGADRIARLGAAARRVRGADPARRPARPGRQASAAAEATERLMAEIERLEATL